MIHYKYVGISCITGALCTDLMFLVGPRMVRPSGVPWKATACRWSNTTSCRFISTSCISRRMTPRSRSISCRGRDGTGRPSAHRVTGWQPQSTHSQTHVTPRLTRTEHGRRRVTDQSVRQEHTASAGTTVILGAFVSSKITLS